MSGYEGAVNTNEALIQELVTRGVDSVYPSPDALTEELRTGRQLTAYMGIDPKLRICTSGTKASC
jgi:tyrosyl-tRNA synthetase